MIIDNKIQDVFKFLFGRDILWHDFKEVGCDETWYMWYYAEDRLYLLRDVMTDAIWFVEAGRPADALAALKLRISEAEHAGEWVVEEDWWKS